MSETLWLRALHVVDARGLLPSNKASLTPAELAAEAAQRGEDRLTRLVDGWYYPASYGRVRGMLSDKEAGRLVAALEAERALAEIASATTAQPAAEKPRAQRKMDCELCGFPLT
jgi:hypothetical protein